MTASNLPKQRRAQTTARSRASGSVDTEVIPAELKVESVLSPKVSRK